MTYIDGGVTAPKGYTASGVSAGIKKSGKKDCSLIASERMATVAGMFTKNLMKSPPVLWNAAVCQTGRAQAVFTNSGNANAATGEQGIADVCTTAELVANGLGVSPQEICICSTGVIGVTLPMDRIEIGVASCLESLSASGSLDAATAIMTTDTVAKELACEVPLEGGVVRIGAIMKGSGMISPNMATMICILTTDAAIGSDELFGLLRASVEVSFNCISIDNDMSTSDTVLCFANGASGVHVQAGTPNGDVFTEALTNLCKKAAHMLVKDGEGVTKFVEIVAEGTANDEQAKTIARTISHSHLVKTAFFGQDPNWGRIACAAGYAGVDFDPEHFSLWLNDVQLVSGGRATDYEEKDAAAVMRLPEFQVRVSVGNGPGRAVFWTCDLSYDYVRINADYRS